MDLTEKRCVPCEGDVPPLSDHETEKLLGELTGWAANVDAPGEPRKLFKRFEFPDFLGAIAFVDRVAALAEEEQHHPDFCVRYSRVEVTLWTHAIRGLSENDFILAAKIDAIGV